MRHAGVLVICLFIGGCTLDLGTGPEQKLVDRFHAELDRQHYGQIYAGSDGLLSEQTSKAKFVRLLAAVHDKFGNVRSATLNEQKVTVNKRGTFVVLRYRTLFQRGAAVEAFTWHRDGDEAKIAGYYVDAKR